MRVSDLSGAELDYWVAKALGLRAVEMRDGEVYIEGRQLGTQWSTNWNDGGPIIERESIGLERYTDGWGANLSREPHNGEDYYSAQGPTPLIAAMRCFVASRFGEVTPDRETT